MARPPLRIGPSLVRLPAGLILLTLVAHAPGCASPDEAETAAASPTTTAPAPAAELPHVEDMVRGYTQLTRVTPEPVPVNPELARMCAPPTRTTLAELSATHGPHAGAFVSIFMNDAAAEAFRSRARTYPVGAVVVKEKVKTAHRDRDAGARPARPHDGVGGMIKRAPGYDPAHGDWEYFYFEDVTEIEHGRIGSCVRCHAGAAGTDHVFGGWAAGN